MPGFSMNRLEKRAAVSLGGVYAVRMLGLFMIFPVFALHSGEFRGATHLLAGVALGIYGLTQALMQIPMGMLSDRWGRKRVIVAGLAVFCAGSLVAASSETIGGVIAGRALQGLGAVASALMALAADLSREEQRSKVNAAIGASIGVAFALALVLGPAVQAVAGLSGIFLLTAALGVAAIVLVAALTPSPPAPAAPALGAGLRAAFARRDLLRLYGGIFALHAAMAANFLVLPQLIGPRLGLAPPDHWLFYLLLLPASFALMLPALIAGEKRRRVKGFFLAAIIVAAAAQAVWALPAQAAAFVALIVLFFTAFMYLEASLPALVSRTCAADARGASMGVFAAAQFFGVFCGAAGAGLAGEWLGSGWIAPLAALPLLAWFAAAFGMAPVGAGARRPDSGTLAERPEK